MSDTKEVNRDKTLFSGSCGRGVKKCKLSVTVTAPEDIAITDVDTLKQKFLYSPSTSSFSQIITSNSYKHFLPARPRSERIPQHRQFRFRYRCDRRRRWSVRTRCACRRRWLRRRNIFNECKPSTNAFFESADRHCSTVTNTAPR